MPEKEAKAGCAGRSDRHCSVHHRAKCFVPNTSSAALSMAPRDRAFLFSRQGGAGPSTVRSFASAESLSLSLVSLEHILSKRAALGSRYWSVHDEERRLLQSFNHLRLLLSPRTKGESIPMNVIATGDIACVIVHDNSHWQCSSKRRRGCCIISYQQKPAWKVARPRIWNSAIGSLNEGSSVPRIALPTPAGSAPPVGLQAN